MKMSKDIFQKSEEHEVKLLFKGKTAFFEVKSVSGEKYTVQFKASCDCAFMGREGIASGFVCSHILAVLKSICEGRNGFVKCKKE